MSEETEVLLVGLYGAFITTTLFSIFIYFVIKEIKTKIKN